jgi:hypothetical protein
LFGDGGFGGIGGDGGEVFFLTVKFLQEAEEEALGGAVGFVEVEPGDVDGGVEEGLGDGGEGVGRICSLRVVSCQFEGRGGVVVVGFRGEVVEFAVKRIHSREFP